MSEQRLFDPVRHEALRPERWSEPVALTCIAPRMLRSIFPPRIIAKLSWLPKMLLPGSVVTVCLPALMRSAST